MRHPFVFLRNFELVGCEGRAIRMYVSTEGSGQHSTYLFAS